jgi:hypothetical protein
VPEIDFEDDRALNKWLRDELTRAVELATTSKLSTFVSVVIIFQYFNKRAEKNIKTNNVPEAETLLCILIGTTFLQHNPNISEMPIFIIIH